MIIPDQRITKLIDATLAYNSLRKEGCFVSNRAAEELENIGVIALSKIELYLYERILPSSEQVEDHNELIREFPGLIDLWMIYFSLMKDNARIIDFLNSLRGPVLATGLLALGSVWRKSSAFPELLLRFVLNASHSEDSNEALAASVCLRSVGASTPKDSC